MKEKMKIYVFTMVSGAMHKIELTEKSCDKITDLVGTQTILEFDGVFLNASLIESVKEL